MIHRILSFALLVSMVGCSQISGSGDLSTRLTEAVKKKRSTKKEVFIEMDKLTDFEWDKLYLFGPYTPSSHIEDTLGFKWRKKEVPEGVTLLIFTLDSRVVATVEHPRNFGDFSYLSTDTGFTPSQAKFLVKAENRGQEWYTLR
jgi:hypothetical protein